VNSPTSFDIALPLIIALLLELGVILCLARALALIAKVIP
jgi:hypothetical protein